MKLSDINLTRPNVQMFLGFLSFIGAALLLSTHIELLLYEHNSLLNFWIFFVAANGGFYLILVAVIVLLYKTRNSGKEKHDGSSEVQNMNE